MTPSRRQALTAGLGVGVAGVAGCLDGLFGTSGPDPTEPSSDFDVPLRDHEVPLIHDFSEFTDGAVSGGVGQDGIPSIDDPDFDTADSGGDSLTPGAPVFGVEKDGDARAYPQRILVRHEIVNDEFDGDSIAVTYCPLTGTAIGFERGSVEFGVSGMLVNSNLIMYDRDSEGWWPQILGVCVNCDAAIQGRALREVRVTWTTWERWKETYPETQVLTENTGEAFDYDRQVYGSYDPPAGYYANGRIMFSLLSENDTHHPKEVFIGARSADGAVAFHKNRLREDNLLDATVNGTPYLAAYHHDLDSAWVYRNPEGMEFEAGDGGYRSADGDRYAADELPLSSVNAFDAMWFAWAAFYPNTVVVD